MHGPRPGTETRQKHSGNCIHRAPPGAGEGHRAGSETTIRGLLPLSLEPSKDAILQSGNLRIYLIISISQDRETDTTDLTRRRSGEFTHQTLHKMLLGPDALCLVTVAVP